MNALKRENFQRNKITKGLIKANPEDLILISDVDEIPNLEKIDFILFDIQDVGVRFYTYLSTLHYIMEACAENGIKLIVLDRPNPNIHYIDGPVMEDENKSFLGMHPVPIVYGMTIGEYAKMINGEGWLSNGISCDLKVIPIQNYTHKNPSKSILIIF